MASDLTERLAPYEGRDVPEVQMLELIEGADNLGHNLGHLCNAMKIRWHHVVTLLTSPHPTPQATQLMMHPRCTLDARPMHARCTLRCTLRNHWPNEEIVVLKKYECFLFL